MLKYSIITCVKNAENHIERCLKSVDSLKHNNFEHIIFDGKSTDNTSVIIQSYNKEYRRVISQKDKGLYDALNQAIKLAKGQYIILLHADDTFASNTILDELDLFIESKNYPEVILCNIKILNAHQKIIRRWSARSFLWIGVRNGWTPPHTGMVLKHSVYRLLLPYSNLYSISSDFDFTIRLLKMCTNYSFLPTDLVHMSAGGMSTSPKNALKTLSQDIAICKNNKVLPWAPYVKRILKIVQFL